MTTDITYAPAFAEPLKQRVLQVVLLLLAAAGLFLIGAARTALTDKEESRYALVAKNMVDTSDYLHPQKQPGDPYFDKPPLYFWMTAGVFKLLGPTTLAARIVPVAGSVLVLLATYLIAATLFNHIIGMMSAGTLATALITLFFGRYVRMDIWLSAFVAFSLWAFIQGYRRPDRRGWYILMYIPMALGTLLKGPVAIFLPGATIFLFLLLQRQLTRLWEMRLILGIAIVLAISGWWFLLMAMTYPCRNGDTVSMEQYIAGIRSNQPTGTPVENGYFREFFLRHNAARAGSNHSFGHDTSFMQAVLIYPAVLFAGMLPWTGVALLAVLRYLRDAFRRHDADVPSLILLLWAGIVVLFFALAGTKLPHYILPAFVPLAVVTGRYLYDYWQADWPRRRTERSFRWTWPVAIVTSAAIVVLMFGSAVLAVLAKFSFCWTQLTDLYGDTFWGNYGWLICVIYRLALVVLAARLFLALLRRHHLEQLACAWVAAIIVLAVDISTNDIPRLADTLSARRLVSAVIDNTQETDPVVFGPEERWSLPFYLDNRRTTRFLPHIACMGADYRDFAGQMVYLSTDDDSFDLIPPRLRPRRQVLHQFRENRLVRIDPMHTPSMLTPSVPMPTAPMDAMTLPTFPSGTTPTVDDDANLTDTPATPWGPTEPIPHAKPQPPATRIEITPDADE